jgi:hypothetical protein
MTREFQGAAIGGLYLAVAAGAAGCLPLPGVPCGDALCSDRERCVSLGPEGGGGDGGNDQLVCVTTTIGQSCAVDLDCTPAGICDAGRCRVPRSCAEIVQHLPGSSNGVYSIAPGNTEPFRAYCDMTRDGGGWTLLLKASGDATLGYSAPAWTSAALLHPDDVTLGLGNAKYQSFLSLPVTTLRGELDGFRYRQDFTRMTAQQIFNQPAAVVQGFPTFHEGGNNWSTQPYCQMFGVNTTPAHTRTRFGWIASGQGDCTANYTAIGLGLMNDGTDQRGAGYECLGPACSPDIVNTGGQGLLWGRE